MFRACFPSNERQLIDNTQIICTATNYVGIGFFTSINIAYTRFIRTVFDRQVAVGLQ